MDKIYRKNLNKTRKRRKRRKKRSVQTTKEENVMLFFTPHFPLPRLISWLLAEKNRLGITTYCADANTKLQSVVVIFFIQQRMRTSMISGAWVLDCVRLALRSCNECTRLGVFLFTESMSVHLKKVVLT